MNKEERKNTFLTLLELISFCTERADIVRLYDSEEWGDLDDPEKWEIANEAGFVKGIMYACIKLERCL